LNLLFFGCIIGNIMERKRISRRDFIKITALAATGLGLTPLLDACANEPSLPPESKEIFNNLQARVMIDNEEINYYLSDYLLRKTPEGFTSYDNETCREDHGEITGPFNFVSAYFSPEAVSIRYEMGNYNNKAKSPVLSLDTSFLDKGIETSGILTVLRKENNNLNKSRYLVEVTNRINGGVTGSKNEIKVERGYQLDDNKIQPTPEEIKVILSQGKNPQGNIGFILENVSSYLQPNGQPPSYVQ
jgi:hypothetical protein